MAEPGEGPVRRELKWLYANLGSTYARVCRPDHWQAPDPAEPLAIGDVRLDTWRTRLSEYQRRRHAQPAAPAAARANAWRPLGPAALTRGQAFGRPAMSGRIAGLAIARGARRVYAATAIGGVWRSDDAGHSWTPTTDDLELQTTAFASSSMACGAIAIDPENADRVYVGTGEGNTAAIFARRLVQALPAYRGVGLLRSDDGGATWSLEPTARGSPSLTGRAFFALAVAEDDPNNVVGATTAGLYQRTADPTNKNAYLWTRRQRDLHWSAVVSKLDGQTIFFAASSTGVSYSKTGATWRPAGRDFPAGQYGRIGLGVRSATALPLYAVTVGATGHLIGLYRLDDVHSSWHTVGNVPDFLLGGQGDYDLALAVDPNDADRIYLGGDRRDVEPYPAAIFGCTVTHTDAGYVLHSTAIGDGAHADVHVLVHAPGDSNTLWAGCDGGVFVNLDPRGGGGFVSRNAGLGALATTYFGQHPHLRSVIVCGLQDNGTARYTGDEVWRQVNTGDGGYCVVNWRDPSLVLVYANGTVYRALDGGQDWASFAQVTTFPWRLMDEPLVGVPPGDNPRDADVVALAVGTRIHISTDFGQTWPTSGRVDIPEHSGFVYSLAFASAQRLYAGTTTARVFRVDWMHDKWQVTPLGQIALHEAIVGPVSDIAVDWSDPRLESVFVAFGGSGDYRHVWRFDGESWHARSGAAGSATCLMDVEHNALAVDRVPPHDVYVGADVGVWHSSDGGANWEVLDRGLPDGPVFDVQVHPSARLLRASVHGRGLFEFPLDTHARQAADAPLVYLRHGPAPSANSPSIRVDPLTSNGYQTPTSQLDIVQFDGLTDGNLGAPAVTSPADGACERSYVLVHNAGLVAADNVSVVLAATVPCVSLPPLPEGFAQAIRTGQHLQGRDWIILGVETVSNVHSTLPAVAAFELLAARLPANLPGLLHYSLLALVDSVQDPFASEERDPNLLAIRDRRMARRSVFRVDVQPPAPGTVWPATLVRLDLFGPPAGGRQVSDLVVDASEFAGRVIVFVPHQVAFVRTDGGFHSVRGRRTVERTAREVEALKRSYASGGVARNGYMRLLRTLRDLPEYRALELRRPTGSLNQVTLRSGERGTVFVDLQPDGAEIGSVADVNIRQYDHATGEPRGGATLRLVVNAARS